MNPPHETGVLLALVVSVGAAVASIAVWVMDTWEQRRR